MTTPDPNDPNYRNHAADQNEQVETDQLDGDKSWQAGDYNSETAVAPQVPTQNPTGEDTELNTRDE